MRFHNAELFRVNTCNKTEYIEKTLKFSFTKGFYSTSTNFPVFSSEEGGDLGGYSSHKLVEAVENHNIQAYTASSDSAFYIDELNDKSKKGLESLFDLGFLLFDDNNDLLADRLEVKFDLKNLDDKSVLAAACNLAFRFAMSTTSFKGSLIASEDYRGNRIIFEGEGKPSISYTEEENKTIHIYGTGLELENFICKVCMEVPELGCQYYWKDYKEDFANSFKLRNLDGQLAYAKAFDNSIGKNISLYCQPDFSLNHDRIKSEFKNVNFIDYKADKKIYSKEYDIEWEVDEFKRIVETDLLSSLIGKNKLKIKAALNENKDIRDRLSLDIKNILAKEGIESEVEIACAYKQGYSWISEFVIPKLKGKKISGIIIRFKAFLADGQSDWLDEDGSIPSYSNFGSYDENKWYDLPIRFLQELYPVDEIIAKELGISKDDIKFELYRGSDDLTYEFIAIDELGNRVLSDSYKVESYERPYISEIKGLGKVHPSTGYLKAYYDNEFFYRQIRTDTDRVWDIFQNEILPDSKKFILDKYKDNLTKDKEPFFSKLEIRAELSEPDFRTGTREDMISSLDGLHEDIYFVATDYFKNLGFMVSGKAFDAPGLILPDLRVGVGKPKLKVSLFDRQMDRPGVLSDSKFFTYKSKNPKIYVDEIYLNENEDLAYNIKTENCDQDMLKAYFDLLAKGILGASHDLAYISTISLKDLGLVCSKARREKPKFDTQKDIEIINSIDFKEGHVIGYDDYIEIIEKLKEVSCLKVYLAGKSYKGRLIYGVDLLSEKDKGFVSPLKSITFNPSQLINCRHHANEVSSTNAAFKIIKEFVTNEEVRNLADDINISIIPVENVDGTHLHYELSRVNPNWKFHVARFDSLSKEFFTEMFNEDTIHTEAHAFAKIYKRILPDLIVDNHGVPSHEWEQEFSGYTSPSFKGFWLPRSILYGYFWPPKDEKFKDNNILCEKIQEEVADEISKHKDLKDLNLEWKERFEKYAHNWMPKLFPADYYNNMIFYWIYKDYSPNGSYVSWRHPWINTAYFTSEVADETAEGDYLKTCTDAHFYHNMRILRLMAGTKKVYCCENHEDGSNLILNLTRQRPILV